MDPSTNPQDDTKQDAPAAGQDSQFPPRQMHQGNWQCSECGKEITELPFEPAQDRPIFCRDC